jgi:ATP-dependent RNA helicase DDX55/SPB4
MDRLPRQRRTGLFSATQTEAVQALARAGLRNPVRVNVAVAPRQQDPPSNPDDNREAPSARSSKKLKKPTNENQPVAVEPPQSNQQLSLSQITPSTLSVHYTVVETAAKVPQLAAFLAAHASEKIIVYFLTCACVDYFALALPRLPPCRQLALHALHGRMRQHSREAVLEAFATSSSGVLLATDVAARGLDIPNVHWVVQFDAPQDPSAFVHRCGRTARMGRSGQALAYVTPAEVPYADFLRLRKIPLAAAAPLNTDKDCLVPQQRVHNGGVSSSKGQIVHQSREAKGCEMVEQFNPNDAHSNETADIDKNDSVDGHNGNLFSGALGMLRKAAESDRALMEAGTKAFVSYIRAYKEHHCRYIFRMDDLRLGQLAASFALLRLPRMPEVKKAARNAAAGGDVGAGLKLLDGFEPSQIDPDTIKFRDKTREKQRQAVLKQRAARDESLQGVSKRPKRGDKHDGKLVDGRDKQSKSQGAVDAGQRLPAAKRRQLEMRQEFEDLNDEYALLRKLKRGKISQREYDVAVGLSSDDDDVDVDMEGKAGSGGNDSDDDEGDGTREQKSSIAEEKARLGTRNYVEDALKKKARRKKKQKGRKTNNMF